MGMEFFIVIGVFPVELLACQVSMFCNGHQNARLLKKHAMKTRTTPSPRPSTARNLSLVVTLNGTHSHLESTRSTSSEHSPH